MTPEIDPGGPLTDAAYNARSHYRGEVADSYLRHRSGRRKWRIEQRAFEELIRGLPERSSILDVPVGTGRFLDACRQAEHRFIGLDISSDMLSHTRPRDGDGDGDGDESSLVQGDAVKLPFVDSSIDCVLSVRFLNLLPARVLGRAIAEMARVAREKLFLEVRVEAEAALYRRLWGTVRALARHPVSSAGRLSRPLRSGRHEDRGGSGYFIHPEREVRHAIAAAALDIERVVYLDEGTAYTRRLFRFTPLRIYVLGKRAGLGTALGQPGSGR